MPAWERTEGAKNRYSLLGLLDDDASSIKTPKFQTDVIAAEKRAAMTQLARERGEQSAQPILQPEIPHPQQQRDVLEHAETTTFPIRERVQVAIPEPPRQDSSSTGDIEGYIPKVQPQKSTTSKDDDDDAEDADWTFR